MHASLSSPAVDRFPTDLALRDAMLAREPDAFRAFHRRYDRLVRSCIERVLRRFPGQRALDDLEDVCAQFVVDLTSRDMSRLRQFAPERGSKLGTFVGMIATNTAWDHVRALSRRAHRTVDVGALELACDQPDPSEVAVQRERCRRIGEAVRSLSTRDQDFVQLYFLEGLEPEDVARRMAISVKTVYSKTHKIRARLLAIDAA